MRGSMVVRAAALTLSIAALIACGSADDSAEQTGDISIAQSVAGENSPLVELIGFSSDPEVNRQQFAAIQQQSDELVIACMAAQGFEWQPTAPLPGSALAPGNRTSLAWARSHGLGITDQLTFLGRGAAADPNATLLAALSQVDQQRYQTALWGDTSALVPDSDEPVVYAPAGCLGEAFASTRPLFDLYQEFEDELRILEKRVNADPRLTNQKSDWAVCMNQAGHPYPDHDAMTGDIVGRLLAISGVEQIMVSSDSTPSQAASAAMFEGVDQVALQALVDFERTVAVANVECVTSTLGDIGEIRATYEREFIVDHRPRLEAAKALAVE